MSVSRRELFATGAAAALSGLASKTAAAATPADIIFFGGSIVTMNDAQPTAGAVAVKGGEIVAVGAVSEVRAQWAGSGTRLVDLAGKALLPGFIDGHGHFMNAPRVIVWANCSGVPVGPVKTIPDIITALKANVIQQKIGKGEWVVGYGYDATGLGEGREMTRQDLDAAFPDNPVMVIHVSNHGGVLNSIALKQFDITAATPTPPGGLIAREPGSQQPAGLLMETAFMPIFAKVPQPSEAQLLELLKPAQELYASKGMTTAQEGATHADELTFLRKAAEQNRLVIDVVSLPFVLEVPKIFEAYVDSSSGKPVAIGDPSVEFGSYKNRLKLGGVKLVTDGSPQGKTAYWTQPLLTGGPNGEKDWVGEPTFPKELIDKMFAQLTAKNIQIWTHANGDAAIDLAIAGARGAGVKAGDDRRYVIIHSQCMRPDQLDSYVELGLSPSFFTLHTYYWGDVHLANLGQERAFFISPMKSATAKGLKSANHHDFMITPIDPMLMVWSAVQRKSKTDVVVGPDERVDVMTALKAITIVPAWQYREEGSKGSIEVGKRADLVILDNNPLTVAVDEIPKIKVVETFKDGSTIYSANQKAASTGVEGRSNPIQDAGLGMATRVGCGYCEGRPNETEHAAAVATLTELADSPLFS